MKKSILWFAVFMIAPFLTSAQSRWSVSPAIGFYKAELDALTEQLNLAETFGATVQKPNGNFHFGGRLHYEKSPRWNWLAEVNLWKDQGAGSLRGVNETLNFEDQVRLIPILVGSQYYFSAPKTKTKVYAGAVGGIMLVNVKSQINLVSPGAGSQSETTERSGNDFLSKPFIGLEVARDRKISFWGELGYVLGKFTIEQVDPNTGTTSEEDVSINGLHVSGGVKFRL